MTFKDKLHAHAWYILINALLAILISYRYFVFLPDFPTDLLSLIFILVSAVSQMTMLTVVIGVAIFPVLFFSPKLRNISQALFASFGIAVLVIDTLVFAQYRFHMNAVVLDLVLSGQIVSFPLVTWITVSLSIIVLLFAQLILIRWLERGPRIRSLKIGRKFILFCFLSFALSNAIHIWSAAHAYQPVTLVKRYLPIFYPATANRFMQKQGWVNESALKRQKALAITRQKDVNYPVFPLDTKKVNKLSDVVFIVIDSWRADTFNIDNTPAMWKYAQEGVVFKNHISTGNSTLAGIFGLFYGLPGSYWHSFLANQQSPLLIQRMQSLNYQLGIFAAAKLTKPEFNQTVFSSVENLRLGSKGNRPYKRDADLTQAWLDWNQNRDKSRPAFSFLFYDAPHGYDFPKSFKPRYEPMLNGINYLKLDNDTDPIPFINRYKTSVRYVDSMAEKVLNKLNETGSLKNTLVIITGDHGQEANDNKLNYWGHNSNFTNSQVNVPFAIFGPGINIKSMKQDVNSFSSHQDVVPTIMKNYLGVANDIKDYSVGEDLLGEAIYRDWIISSNYSRYAIIDENSILEVSANGQYQFLDKTNREIKDRVPNFLYMKEALEQMSRFNK